MPSILWNCNVCVPVLGMFVFTLAGRMNFNFLQLMMSDMMYSFLLAIVQIYTWIYDAYYGCWLDIISVWLCLKMIILMVEYQGKKAIQSSVCPMFWYMLYNSLLRICTFCLKGKWNVNLISYLNRCHCLLPPVSHCVNFFYPLSSEQLMS